MKLSKPIFETNKATSFAKTNFIMIYIYSLKCFFFKHDQGMMLLLYCSSKIV